MKVICPAAWACSAATATSCASSKVVVSGFSHMTCLPAARPCSVSAAWNWSGVTIVTASQSSSRSS